MSNLQVGSAMRIQDELDIPGRWSVWSRSGEALSSFVLTPLDADARGTGIKYVVVQAVMGRHQSTPALSLIRTDPPQPTKGHHP